MMKNININKNFFIALVFIGMLIASFGVIVENGYAADVNETNDNLEIKLDVQDKLENSQINNNNLMVGENNENILNEVLNNEILSADKSFKNGGSFSDIRSAIEGADDGDTITLSGKFVSDGEGINIKNRVNIISKDGAILDGNGLSNIFSIGTKGAGTVISGLTFVNGLSDIGSAIKVRADDVTVDNCIFLNNTAGISGGAIYTTYDLQASERFRLTNCYFKDNHARETAGAVGVFGNNSEIMNCIFDSNYVKSDNFSYGGAVQVGLLRELSFQLVQNCTFKNNRAIVNNVNVAKGNYSHGGAGCIRKGCQYIDCTFINNSAHTGGAIYFHDDGELKNCLFVDNTATLLYGGAVDCEVSSDFDLGITDCIFRNNKAPAGGAVRLNGYNVVVSDSKFENNHATNDGGAISINAENVKISDSDFSKNIADNDGGALFLIGKDTTISNSNFISNNAIPDLNKKTDGLGGAIYINSSKAVIENNNFEYNTARNGSAVYYDAAGENLILNDNWLKENQAWVYALPIFAQDINYGEKENIKAVIHGGNNIARYGDLAVSNAIYNAAERNNIKIDGETPENGARNDRRLYQDDREYDMEILLNVKHEDGTVVYNKVLNSSYLGEVSDVLSNLKPGKYYVTATHIEDNYYKAITNTTSFVVRPLVDIAVKKSVLANKTVYHKDQITWSLNVVNNGPNDASNVVLTDILPNGLSYVSDDSKGAYNPKTGLLTLKSLKVNEVFNLNIVTSTEKTGEIINEVNVKCTETDIDLSNNKASSSVYVNPSVDIASVKTVNVPSPNLGENIIWTITVKNNGPDTATGVKVIDRLPTSLIYVSNDKNYDASTGIWNVGSLAKGAQSTLNIVCRVNTTGNIRNLVSVKGNEFDPNLSNNNASAIINAKPSSDLSIVKSVNTSRANYGDLVKWTLTVSNNGPNTATNVKVQDVLPKGFVYVDSKAGKGSYSNGIFTINTLAVGEKVNLEIVSKVTATGNFINYANVTANEFDPNLNNNRDDESVVINPASDLAVVKSVNQSNPHNGENVKWTITVKNNGPDTATGVEVRDVLPSSLIYVSNDKNYNVNTGIWNVGSLAKGAQSTLNIVCRVNTTGNIRNLVSVKGNEFDPNLSNNNASAIINAKPSSDLSIVKSVNTSRANYGDLVKWTLTVSNNGPNAATNVKVQDVLPKGFVYVDSKAGKGSYSNGVFTINTLAVGEKVNLEIVSKVTATGNFINYANVTANEFDPNLNNNRDDESVVINPASDLAVVKSVNQSNPHNGENVKWTITVKNNGPDTVHDVVVRDVLDKALVWVNDDGSGQYNPQTGVWNVGTLNVGQSKGLTITTKVITTGIIVNNVNITGKEFDYDQSNNRDNKTVDVLPSADVSVTKMVNQSNPNYGDLIKWTVIVSNNGPDKANGVYVDEILPEGLIFIDYNASKGFYDDGKWSVCCLENKETQVLEIITEVNKTGKINNLVIIHSEEFDPDESNNKYNKSVDVPLAVDIEVDKQVNESNPLNGGAVLWTVSVKNNGPDDATGVVLYDILPDEVTFVNYNSTKGQYLNGKWDIGNLANGKTEYLNILCIVNKRGPISNYANAESKEYDWNKINNDDVSDIDVSPVCDVSVTKFVDNASPNYLDVVTWTLVVMNLGPDNATGVSVIDALPDGLEFIQSSDDENYNDGVWYVGELLNGQTKQLDIDCRVLATGSFTNYAEVHGNEFDPNMENNNDDEDMFVEPASDLMVTKETSKSRYVVGDTIQYVIKVVNNGPDRATNVKVSEILDNLLTLVSFKTTMGHFDKGSEVWTIDSLDVGETAILTIQAIANGVGIAENRVTVSSDNYDPDMSNNNDSVVVEITEKISDNPNKSINPDIPSKSMDDGDLNNYPALGLQEYSTGNPLMVLLCLVVFLMISCTGNIFKRR